MRQCSAMRTSAPSSTRRCLDGTGGGDAKDEHVVHAQLEVGN